MTDKRHILINQSGGIFTFLLGGVALLGALTYGVILLASGPLASGARVQMLTLAKSQLFTNVRVAAVDAAESIQDCDGDDYIEPRAFRTTTGNKPTGGGIVPLEMGAHINDPWGLPYGYCAWDIGGTSGDAACGDLLDGTDDITTGDYESKTVVAMISAGPDRAFDTTCDDYSSGSADVITSTGDDLVYRFSFQELLAYTGEQLPIEPCDLEDLEICLVN